MAHRLGVMSIEHLMNRLAQAQVNIGVRNLMLRLEGVARPTHAAAPARGFKKRKGSRGRSRRSFGLPDGAGVKRLARGMRRGTTSCMEPSETEKLRHAWYRKELAKAKAEAMLAA